MNKINEYINKQDWRVKENSNANFSYAGLQGHIAGAEIAKYTLKNVYTKRIADAHTDCFIHLHDLNNGIMPYCAGWSLADLIKEGFNCDVRFIYSKPAKHFSAILGQMENFLFTLSQEWAGAQAFNSVDTLLAPYIKYDGLTYNQVVQELQQHIFNLNNKYRIAFQTPFSNYSLDTVPPDDLKDQEVIIGGKESGFTYGDCQKEMNIFNRAFMDVMIQGDGLGKPFAFPIPTYSVTKDFKWDSRLAEMLFEMAGKTGVPYFSNFINSSLEPSDVRSLCCRLRLDLRELIKNASGLFSAGDKTGSIGVVTNNLPKMGYLNKGNISGFYKMLNHYLILSKDSLLLKRKEVLKNMNNGLMPYTKRYLGHLDNHFNTIGILGMNECLLNMLGYGIETKDGRKFALEVEDYILGRLADFQEETGLLFNFEATPAEGVTHRFAKHDKQEFPDIITANGKDGLYYTNSTMLPVEYSENIWEVLDHQDELQCKYTSGTVLHIFLNEPVHNYKVIRSLIKKIFTKYKLPYISITPTISVCPVHGRLEHSYEYCPYNHTENEYELAKMRGGVIIEYNQEN
jgi:anaerobic ribonucleoside-triphosphate reductase